MPADKKPLLTIQILKEEAIKFAEIESIYDEPSLFGVTDGKAVGTYLEHKFTTHLLDNYEHVAGNAASGIDIPALAVDIKVTSWRQPQSSCPFQSGRQKIYGLGYNLLIFVYVKSDNEEQRTARLNIQHVIFVDKEQTADFQMTKAILQILENDGNEDDLVALIQDRHLPVDEIEARNIAQELLKNPPEQGYLTISNALQWRLQYGRAITKAGEVEGVWRLR